MSTTTGELIVGNLRAQIRVIYLVAGAAAIGCGVAAFLGAWFIAACEASGFIAALLVAYGAQEKLHDTLLDFQNAPLNDVRWYRDADGGFTAGDPATGMTAYAYSSSDHAERSKQDPRGVALEMVAGELPALGRAETDTARWARLAGGFVVR